MDYNKDGWEPFIKNTGIADETLTKFLNDANQTDKSLEAFKQYPDVVNKTGKAFNFAALGAKAFNIALNAAIFWGITKILEGVVWAVDQYINRVKYAKEAMADAKNNFESVKSELEGINSELEANKVRINELNGLPSLTYVEQGELDKLKEATKELERQRDIKNIELKRAAEDLSESNQKAFNKEYGDNSFSLKDVYELAESETPVVTIAQGGLEDLAAAIIKVRKAQEDAKNAGDNEWLGNMVAAESEFRKQLEDNLSTLQGYRDNLNSIMNYRSLTEDEQSFYDNLEQGMRLIYQFTDPSAWNQIEFDQIFNNDLIDVTKEKLIELSNAGKLDEKTIKQYSKLNDAIAQTDPILNNGETAVQAFINQIIALARESKTSGEAVVKTFTKEDLISSINTLSGGFESLDKIMNSMKGKNPFDYSLLNDKKFTDEFKGMGKAYTDFIETVSSSPKDVNAAKSAFDNLVTTWIDNKGVLSELTEENAGLATAMLQNMGIANAEEVVAARLRKAHEDLAAQKYYDANASTDLENATMSGIAAFVDEAVAAGVSQQAIAELALEKISVNDIKIDTASDIDQVIALANAAGASTYALEQLARAKSAFESINSAIAKGTTQLASPSIGAPVAAGITMATEMLKSNTMAELSEAQKTLEDIANGTFDYQFTLDPEEYKKAVYNGVKSNNPSGSGSKKDKTDTDKEIDWIERDIQKAFDEREKLMKKASDSSIDYFGITNEEFSRATELFNSNLDPMSNGTNELAGIAKRAGMSLSELYTIIANGNPGESRENYLAQVLESDKTLLPKIENAVEQYKQKWEEAASKISPENKAKIELGSMSIDTLSGDELKNVETAMGAFDKYQSMQDSYAEAQKKNTSTIIAQYDNRIAAINKENEQLEKSNSILEARIDYLKTMGEIPSASLYEKLIQNTGTEISNTKKEISAMKAKLRDAFTKHGKNSEEYADLEGEIREAEKSLYGMKKAQEEYNNKLLQMPIENASILVSMYQDIGAAIRGWGDDVVASGGKLDANYYQSLITNGATVVGQLQKQSSLIKDVMDNYTVGSDNWNDLYKQLQSVNSEMSSAIQNIRKFNEELLKMPLENMGNFSSELQKVADGLSKVQSEQDQVISAVTGAIKDQIDLLNEQKDAVNEQKTAEIDALKEKLKLLNKENEYQNLLYDSEQKRYNLDRIKNQKTNQVVREGEIGYEEDAQARREAEQALLDSQYNLEKYNLQEQIDKAQESLDLYNDGLQDQIDALQKISDKWSEINSEIEKAQNKAKADETLGTGWEDKVISGNDEALFNTFSGMYANTAEQLKKYQDQIDSTNNIQSLLEDYIASYKAGEITYTEAVKGINGLLSQLNQKMSATDNLQNIFDYLGTVNDTAANADAILTGIQSGLKDTATELLKSLEQYNKNSGMISEYTSSWQKLTDNVSSMLDVLKEVRDNLKDSYDRDDDDDNDNTRYGGGKDGSPGTPGKGDYVNNGPGVFADGIKNGLVGKSSDSEREKMLKHLATNNLKPGEVPILAHEGEAIFNDEQQNNLLKNLASTNSFKPNIPDYSSFLNQITVRESTPKQEFKFGNINIQECNSANDLAKEILNGGLTRAVIQGLGKR